MTVSVGGSEFVGGSGFLVDGEFVGGSGFLVDGEFVGGSDVVLAPGALGGAAGGFAFPRMASPSRSVDRDVRPAKR